MREKLERIRRRKGITFSVRVLIIIIIVVLGIALVAVIAMKTQGKGETVLGKIMDQVEGMGI